jgi:hypothetical protein
MLMSNLLSKYRLDRSVITVTDFDNPPDDVAYWRTRPIEERLEAVEFLRQMNYGYDPTTAKIQRVLRVVELPHR